ncbi:MAG: phytanoyl-CoA dioxygenase family protein [Planctomycetes bacterium]|nr:phytanoyl-CoA dioxygenase family protein [Planctomycetota bacterium]
MAEDLSRHHVPVGALLGNLPPLADWQRYQLSREQLDFYHAHGYVSGIRLLDGVQVDMLCVELDRLANPNHPGSGLFHEYHVNESGDPGNVLFHALGSWRVEPGFHDLLWNPAMLVPASQLIGGSVRFWHDQLFCKPARHGGVVAWHQDYSYWTRTKPMEHLTCFIALDDCDEENGCLRYVPDTHRWPLLPVTGLAGDMNAIQSVLSPEQRQQFLPVPARLKRGEASFHHPLTVHGSWENRSHRPRRAAVVNVFRDGVCSATDQSLLAGVPVIPSGQCMDGQFFPLLHRCVAKPENG